MADAAVRSRVFDGLTDGERRHWMSAAAVVATDRGDTLVRQGDSADRFFILDSGFLKLLQATSEGAELIIRFVGPGEPFGGVVALGPGHYPVTAMSVQPSKLFAWSSGALINLLTKFPRVRTNIMREMSNHMMDAMTRMRELTSAPVEQRLAYTVLRLGRQYGQKSEEGLRIAQPLTRQDLADLTGTTLYTVSRTLSKWQQMGLVTSRQRHLIVPSMARIESLANERS